MICYIRFVYVKNGGGVFAELVRFTLDSADPVPVAGWQQPTGSTLIYPLMEDLKGELYFDGRSQR